MTVHLKYTCDICKHVSEVDPQDWDAITDTKNSWRNYNDKDYCATCHELYLAKMDQLGYNELMAQCEKEVAEERAMAPNLLSILNKAH